MKTIRSIAGISCALLLFVAGCTSSRNTQAGNSTSKYHEMVTGQHYVFTARSVSPSSGHAHQLTESYYDLKVSKDSVQAYLPYFGRAYSAPIDPTKGGIQFESTDFEYQLSDRKNGGWSVSIKPHDVRDVQQLSLTISTEGYASLQVISNNRQPISFNGTISDNAATDQ